MGMPDYRINEYGEIIRDEVPSAQSSENKWAEYEAALLRQEKVDANIRRKIAKTTKNETVLWICLHDKNITVRQAACENPLTSPYVKSQTLKQIAAAANKVKTSGNKKEEEEGCLSSIFYGLIGVLAIPFVILGDILESIFGWLIGKKK